MSEELHEEEPNENASGTDYAELFKEAERVDDPAKAEAMAYAGKDFVEAAIDSDAEANDKLLEIKKADEAQVEEGSPLSLLERESQQNEVQLLKGAAARYDIIAEQRMSEAAKKYDSQAE